MRIIGQGKLLIFTAVRLETRAVASALGARWRNDEPINLRFDGWEIELRTLGIRAVRLPAVAEVGNIAGIILAGLGGALDPSLHVGDVVGEFVSPSPVASNDEPSGGLEQLNGSGGRSTAAADLELHWFPELPAGEGGRTIRRGRIHTESDIVTTAAAKAMLFRSTGALAVDMEGTKVRQLAAALGVPFLHVRGISDSAATSLDPVIVRLINDVGKVRPLRLASALVRRPGLIPELKQLGSHSKLAADRVAAFVRDYLAGHPFPNESR